MTHSQSLRLLPWYATLDDERRRELDAHTRNCPECALELAEIHALQKTLAPLEDVPEPGPFMLARTLSKIDTYEQEKAARPMGWRRAMAWWFESALPARALIAAEAALILFLGVGAVHFYRQAEAFSTLSGPVSLAAGSRLTVAFQPGVSEEALRQAVRKVNGTIVGGPSALGIYTVQIPPEADPKQVAAGLRENSAVVRLAEEMVGR